MKEKPVIKSYNILTMCRNSPFNKFRRVNQRMSMLMNLIERLQTMRMAERTHCIGMKKMPGFNAGFE